MRVIQHLHKPSPEVGLRGRVLCYVQQTVVKYINECLFLWRATTTKMKNTFRNKYIHHYINYCAKMPKYENKCLFMVSFLCITLF